MNSRDLRADLMSVETITLIQNPEIRSELWTTPYPVGQAFGDCFVSPTNRDLMSFTFSSRRIATNEFDNAVQHTYGSDSRSCEFASNHAH